MFGFLFAVSANAEVLDKSAVMAGMKVQYRVVLPQPYDPARAYPGVLAFVGGGQTFEMVKNEVDRTWKPEAERRGYIVILPAAPDGQQQRGFRIQYKVEPKEPHLIQALQGTGVKRLFDQFESCK